ncbi:MAG TPA: hypothetical protein PLJ21_05135 [Pseudobdellovibrionaceae bacterium]|nr:hypothetical protein [Pseudobdellovibrionaceae bacterium]
MKIKLILSFAILMGFEHSSWAQDVLEKKIEKQHWKLDFRSQVIQAPSISLTIVNKESELRTRVNLPASVLEKGLWSGTFSVRFAKGLSSLDNVEFITDKGQRLVFEYASAGKYINFVLWPDKKEQKQIDVKPVVPVVPVAPVVSVVPPKEATPKGPTLADLKKIEEDRQKIEMDEALKQAHRLEQMQKQTEAQKLENQKKSMIVAAQALEFYRKANYQEAAGKFEEANQLDPENYDFVYQHAISRYKIDEYNKSLALLALSDGADVNSSERAYYVALNHMKLKEYDLALKEFKEIAEENDPVVSPLSSFFAGHIEFKNQKYPQARKYFEQVLDQSKDPKLDKQADEMLDQIDNMEAFLAASRERYKYSLFIGPVYDSNVLNISTGSVATDVTAWRANYGGNFVYHMVKELDWSWDFEISMNDYYSLDSSFKSNATLQAADALELNLNFPIYWGKWTFSPAYKNIYIAPSGGTRISAISSMVGGIEWAHALSQEWLGRYKGEFTSDGYYLASSEDDNQAGTRTTLSGSFTRLLDLRGTRSFTTDVSYLMANTTGKNYRSTKPALGFTYGYVGYWKQPGSLRLDFSSQAYAEASTTRTDQVIGLSVTQQKKMNDRWMMSLVGSYNLSQSGVESYNYNKFSFSALFTYSQSVLKD